MHWAQVEPELDAAQPQKWGPETISTRWHSHYRMFNERVKTDAARKLRKFVLSRVNSNNRSNNRSSSGSRDVVGISAQEERSQIPSPSWCPLSQSLAKRASFLEDAANFFLNAHSGLPRQHCRGELTAVDWFTSAYTIVEARSLLVTMRSSGDGAASSSSSSSSSYSEWMYIPLLDFATPGVVAGDGGGGGRESSQTANIDLIFTRATLASNHLAVRVVTRGIPISKGSPLVFAGWSGNGLRTAADGLELFGFLNNQMGFAETATSMLPFGPILHHHHHRILHHQFDRGDGSEENEQRQQRVNSRRSVLDECRARCKRVSDGKTISMMHSDGYSKLLKERSESISLRPEEQQQDQDLRRIRRDDESAKSPSSFSSSSACCCNLRWLDAKLRRRWKQVTANDLLWNVPRELLKKMMWGISKIPREVVSSSSSSGQEPEPPLWKTSRQYLISSTRKVLETHILELSQEMQKRGIQRVAALKSMPANLSGLNTKELVAVVFGDEDDETPENRKMKVDAPIESYVDGDDLNLDDEAKWFGCCRKHGENQKDDEDEVLPEETKEN